MPRRRNNPIEEFVAVAGGLFVLGMVLSPQFKAVVLLLAIAVFLLFVGWIAYRIATKGQREMQAVNSGCSVSSWDSVAEPSLSEKVRALDWFQFEKLIAAIYETKGYSVKRLGGANPDGGIDLIVEKASDRFVVQCKQWKAWKVGVR